MMEGYPAPGDILRTHLEIRTYTQPDFKDYCVDVKRNECFLVISIAPYVVRGEKVPMWAMLILYKDCLCWTNCLPMKISAIGGDRFERIA